MPVQEKTRNTGGGEKEGRKRGPARGGHERGRRERKRGIVVFERRERGIWREERVRRRA